MKAWTCEHCGADVKQEKEPETCPICFKRGCFDEITLPDPTEDDKMFTEKYEEAIDILEKYEEGTPQRTMADHHCGCGEHGMKKGDKNEKK